MSIFNIKTFWFGDHELSQTSEQLFKTFVPTYGKPNSLQGVLLAASGRITHDFFNNGFGNYWISEFESLKQDIYGLPNKPNDEVLNQYQKDLDVISPYKNPNRFDFDNEDERNQFDAQKGNIVAALTNIHAVIVEAVMMNPGSIPYND